MPAGQALLRSGARVGEDIWATGTLGDAAGALAQWRQRGPASAKLRYRLDRPTPRVPAGLALRGLASAGIDLSDGLAADLGHVLAASGSVPASIWAGCPVRAPWPTSFDENRRWELQLGGGDDYELCFTAPAAKRELNGRRRAARHGSWPGAAHRLRLTPKAGRGRRRPRAARHFQGGHA